MSEDEEKKIYTQDEVDDLLFQERYKNALYEAVRAMITVRCPEHHIINLKLGNPEIFMPADPETGGKV